MSDAININGNWTGEYQYSASIDSGDFPFKAKLLVSGEEFTGLVFEENISQSGRIRAELRGTITGKTVKFSKTYAHEGQEYQHVVEYEGQISADGSEISGTWKLPHDSGIFAMRRDD